MKRNVNWNERKHERDKWNDCRLVEKRHRLYLAVHDILINSIKRKTKREKKNETQMQPFSLHCCHKYKPNKNDYIYYASANKESTETKEPNHNDGFERCWKQTTKENPNETTWLGNTAQPKHSTQPSRIVVWVLVLVCSCPLLVHVSRSFDIHKNMINELWFHIHNPNNKHTEQANKQPTHKNGWN